jgi:ParB-like chromosome segregation protein Spo0J
MRETKNENRVTSIPIGKLIAHPGNPNRMSKRSFARLVRNIERTGRYEPLVVRRQGDCFQIINGHHRCRALQQLGYETVDAVIWDVDDAEADILLTTLNRLGGSDVLEKKLALLDRINRDMHAREMAKLLPFTRSQIEKLRSIKIPSPPAKIDVKSFAVPMVFFLSDAQQQIVEQALSLAGKTLAEKTKAARNAAALTEMAQCFIREKQKSKCKM